MHALKLLYSCIQNDDKKYVYFEIFIKLSKETGG